MLILDNHLVHPKIELQNIKIKSLPNTIIHPLGMDIIYIRSTKAHQYIVGIKCDIQSQKLFPVLHSQNV